MESDLHRRQPFFGHEFAQARLQGGYVFRRCKESLFEGDEQDDGLYQT